MTAQSLTPDNQRVVMEYAPLARRIAHSFSRDDEYESEAMLALCIAIASYDATRGGIRPYVMRVVRNRLRDLKREQRMGGHHETVTRTADYRGAPADGNYAVSERIPAGRSQDAFRLRYCEGLTEHDVAQRLGVSVSSVRRDLTTARRAFFRSFSPIEEGT